IFKMDHKVFKSYKKKGYTFNRRISTDAFGCSILWIQNDRYNPSKKSYVKPIKKPYNYHEDRYIDELSEQELKQIIRFAADDPGYHDIAYFTDRKTKLVEKSNGKKYHKVNKLRFTQDQRRFETKSNVYQKRIDHDKKKTNININNENQ